MHGYVERVSRGDGSQGADEADIGLVEAPRCGAGPKAEHEVVAIWAEQQDLALVLIVHSEQRGDGSGARAGNSQYCAVATSAAPSPDPTVLETTSPRLGSRPGMYS